MNFFNFFKKKEKKLLEAGLNKDVVEGFLDKIEDIVFELKKSWLNE